MTRQGFEVQILFKPNGLFHRYRVNAIYGGSGRCETLPAYSEEAALARKAREEAYINDSDNPNTKRFRYKVKVASLGEVPFVKD